MSQFSVILKDLQDSDKIGFTDIPCHDVLLTRTAIFTGYEK